MSKKRKKKKRMGKWYILLFLLMLGTLSLIVYLNQQTDYHIVVIDKDGNAQEIQTYDSLSSAKENMLLLERGENENIAITTDDGTRLALRYGVVNFRTKQCTVNTSYQVDDREETGYLNGCYGADGAYIDTSDDGKRVKFMIGGVVGWVDRSEVELLNYYDPKEVTSVNHYVVSEGTFLHKGTTDIKQDAYYFSLDVGLPFQNTAYQYYYSYDGHYFYPSFSSMVDDYRASTRKNSVNANEPYYNYYQYLPHRTISNYTAADINKYIESTLGYHALPTAFPMKEQESMLYQSGDAFINAQNQYGANAIMMLSLSINETGYGKSELSFTKHNLFGHAAYDSSPSKSANQYANTAESILVHASVFLNQGYLNSCDGSDGGDACDASKANRYRGAYFGDKESGMNVRYASDPYWGEKAAAFYRKFEKAMGDKDHTFSYIVKNVDRQNVYASPDQNSRIVYKTPTMKNYVFLVRNKIENEQGTWYEIQSDAPLDNGVVSMKSENYAQKSNIVYINEKDFI